MTTTPGLAVRAVRAARAHRAADPDGFRHRHDTQDTWNRWARRARVTRTLATALQVPVDAVLVTDDPHRTYPTRTGPVPGDLITITDPPTGRTWQFIPDHTTPGQAWLLLAPCPDCTTQIPLTRIATLTDLGNHLDPRTHTHLADHARDPAHHNPDCTLVHPTTTTTPREPLFTPVDNTDDLRCTLCGAINTAEGESFESIGGTTERPERCTACGTTDGDCDLSALI
ncbi:hypothetical protein [Saccharothrix sp.]|uniref:hypothetical protein n=1 Tax=Saccharothrix sp. TaxID=1873460 RepID=UPI0028115BA4|nr:hypothetical protein [Saccharothrix sp.]